MTPKDGICPSSHPTRVKQIRHCLDQGITAVVPEAGTSVSAGTQKSWDPEPFTTAMKNLCVARCGSDEDCQGWCASEHVRLNDVNDAETKVGSLTMNNQTMATYICYQEYGYYQPPSFGYGQGAWGLSTYAGPNSNYDAVCCD
jgi:hypothetical protein